MTASNLKTNRDMALSIVIPFYNERDSLETLWQNLCEALREISLTKEIILIDDHSTDGSSEIISRLLSQRRSREESLFTRVRLIRFSRHAGQTAALAAGFDSSSGRIIVTMDADGQNDPKDISLLLRELDKGFDVVSGWRAKRKDPWLTRILPSWMANGIISCMTGVRLHDHGCTLKAYRRPVIENLRLYGEMHRMLVAWCSWRGARITEVPVQHHARRKGYSKYGLNRVYKVVFDIILAKFFGSFITRPLHLFGGFALVLIGGGMISGGLALIDKFGPDLYPLFRIPLLLLAVGLGLAALQMIVIGLLAEILVRIYHEIRHEKPYQVEAVKEFPQSES